MLGGGEGRNLEDERAGCGDARPRRDGACWWARAKGVRVPREDGVPAGEPEEAGLAVGVEEGAVALERPRSEPVHGRDVEEVYVDDRTRLRGCTGLDVAAIRGSPSDARPG
jgi:hypothetical protein